MSKVTTVSKDRCDKCDKPYTWKFFKHKTNLEGSIKILKQVKLCDEHESERKRLKLTI